MHTTTSTLRIMSAALFSLAAAGAHAAGDDSAYPMGVRAGMDSTVTSATATRFESPYVWAGNEAGLVHRNVGAMADQTPPDRLRIPMAEATPGALPTGRQATIFLGA